MSDRALSRTGRRPRGHRSTIGAQIVAGLALAALAVGCAAGDDGDNGDAAERRASSTTARDSATGSTQAGLPAGRDVTVTSITDGDTFRAGDERVRLIGIDAPESSGGVECFAREASAALGRLVAAGTKVRLVADVEPRDRYGRTLAYVHRLSDGEDVNLALVRGGYATPLTVPPNVAREDTFAEAAADARRAGRGLWATCADDVAPTTSAQTGSTSSPAGGCDPAYPDVCIPSPPPDLDCGDITARRFRVLAPDPHHFDGGGDGLGCENLP